MSSTVYRDPDVVIGDNADALRAVNGLLVNEISATAKPQALQAISDVQNACEADLQDLCLAQPVAMSMMQQMQMNDAMDSVFDGIISQMLGASSPVYVSSPSSSSSSYNSQTDSSEEDGEVQTQTIFVEFGRRLMEKEKESEGLRTLHSLAVKLFTPVIKLHDKVVPAHRRLINPMARPPLTAATAAKKIKTAKTETMRKLQRGPPPPPEDEEDSEDEEDGPPRQGPPQGKPKPKPKPKPDTFYSGALGYGAADGCLYKNFHQLQPQCQEAIVNVYQLRQDFWAASQAATTCDHPYHHPHGFPVLLLLAPLFVFLFFKRRARMQAVNKTLDAIHSNPALKAQVEALSGLPVPAAKKCCAGQSNCATMLKAVGTLLAVALCSFIIAATSLVVACGIVGSMSHIGPDGTEVHPSGFVALLVLFIVTALEVVLFVGVVRGCKLMFAPSPFPATASAELVQSEESPSGTLTAPLVPREDGSDGGAEVPRYRSFFARVAGVTRRLSSPFGYMQLPSGDSEMVPLGASASSPSSVELGTATTVLPVYTQLPAGPTTVYTVATAPHDYQQQPYLAGGSPYVKPISIL